MQERRTPLEKSAQPRIWGQITPRLQRRAPSAASRRGSVTVIVMSMIAALGVLVMAMFTASIDTSKWTSRQLSDFRVSSAAESASTLAAHKMWMDFEAFMGDTVPQVADFQAYMDNQGILDQTGLALISQASLLNTTGLAYSGNGKFEVDGVEIELLEAHRFDELASTRIVITATAVSRGGQQGSSLDVTETVQQVFIVEPPDWEGLSYALLANNVNCLMCHTQVDRAARYYNEDPSLYGTFDRVKLGSIESFMLRSDPDSWIAGTTYLGGQAISTEGVPLSAWGAMGLKSREFDMSGHVLEDAWGDPLVTNLSPAATIDPVAGENLYLDYFSGGEDGMVDGFMPETFPSPFPDDGGYDQATSTATPEFADNRIVDYNEFMTTVAKSRGTVTGGIIGVLPKSSAITSAAELDSWTAGTTTSLDSITSGQVYLHGTIGDPIILNGQVAIDGDVVISGYVKGTGTLMASGNVYIPSDILYLDGTTSMGGRTFGVSSDGTQNALAIATAGNIMVGDPYHPPWGLGDAVTGAKTGQFSFILEEMALFNRMEWMNTQETLPGELTWMVVGQNTWEVVHDIEEDITTSVDEPIYGDVITGTVEEPVYGDVQVGTAEEPVYGDVVIDSYEDPVMGDVVTGTYEDPIWETVIIGTEDDLTQPIYADVLVSTYEDPIWGDVVVGTVDQDIWGWVVVGTVDDQPIYENVVVGTYEDPIYGDVLVGTVDEPIWGWVVIGTENDQPIYETVVTGTYEDPIWGDVLVGTVDEPVYGWVVIGTEDDQPIYDDVLVGTVEEPVYDWVMVEDRPIEYGGPIYEWQIVSYNTVNVYENQIVGYTQKDVTEWQITGTQTVNVYENQIIGYNTVEITEQQLVGYTQKDITDWQITGYNTVNVYENQIVGYNTVDIIEAQLVGYTQQDVTEWQITGTETVNVTESQIVGYNTVEVYESQLQGYQQKNITELQITGYNTVNIIESQIVGYNTVLVYENQIIGYNTVPVMENQIIGYNTVDVIENQIIGYNTITTTETVVTGTWTESFSEDIYDFAIPQLTNPGYKGSSYIPRYYAFSPGDPVPIFNKTGHFDGYVWVSEERAGGWDDEKLTYADPTDSTDPLLFNADGSTKAVVSLVTPTGDWVTDELLRGLIQGMQATRDETMDLELDATLYSSNAIFGMAPGRRAPGMNGKLLVNGALVAADVGMLNPKGTRLNYDPRGRDLITIRSNDRLEIRRRLWAPHSPLQ